MHFALDSRPVAQAFPTILAHEGVWAGTYRHVDAEGMLLDEHASRITCEFPHSGPWAYIQHNQFTWADGREQRVTLPGRLQGQRLYWDVESFSGYSWSTDGGILLLHIDRKDEPGAHFLEIIIANDSVTERVRTWHWFKNGQLFKRTLCNERKVAAMSPQPQPDH